MDKYLGVRLLDHMVSVFNFIRNPSTVTNSGYNFALPPMRK